MKKGFLVLATAIMVFAFTSCLDLNSDNNYVKAFRCMVTVTTGGVNPVFQIDNGPFLTQETAVPADTFVVGERYCLYYVLGDTVNHPVNSYPIDLYQYVKTILKNPVVLPKDSTNKWEDQPIIDFSAQFTGHYLNAFFISYAGLSTPNTFELIRLKEDETALVTDTFPKLYFALRHNVAVISSSYTIYQYYSYDLSSLTTEFPNATKFQINLSWNDAGLGTMEGPSTYIPEQTILGPMIFSSIQMNSDLLPTPF